ncbi:MAG TPA: M13 family metallopeptidase [Kofleriaceae bacterium]|nr:M13 family metallopeptidase [Kofleriaceae bacterium]
MRKRLLAAILFAGCGSSPQPKTTTAAPTPPTTTTDPTTAPAPTPATTTAKGGELVVPTPGNPPAPQKGGAPEIGTWGFDLKGMNTKLAPGASFYNYSNGTWLETTPIPEDKSNYGTFGILSDKSDERTKEIIVNAKGKPGSEAKKIADYYASFMDEAGIEKKGIAPIKGELAKIKAVKSAKELVPLFGYFARHFRTSPFPTIVGQDDKAPETHIANIGQGGLGLPDRDMYDAKNAQFEPLREGYKKYIAAMLTLAGEKDAEKRAADIYALEEKIAATHWTRIENRDPQKTYNKLTIDELQKTAPDIDWKAWLKATGLEKVKEVNVNQPSAIAGTAKLVASEPIGVWKDYLTVIMLGEAAPYLPKAFVDTHFEMYGKTLSGTPQIKDRWKRGVDQITGTMGEAVGKLYVEKYFTPATKAQADQLVKNLLTAMGQRLDALAWMGPETKTKAKAKLATYNPKIGYPKKWRDYSKLTIKAGDAFGNADRASAFEYDRRLAKLGKPVDRDEWGMTPMTVNAYYNPALNEIVFPAAILQPPFFDPNADDGVNYGGIGAVIGHEISHGFDDQGSQYDATGKLENWWTKDDETKFKAATAQLVAQYNTYCPFPAAGGKPAQCVKGELTLGENIADLAGLTIAYQAYKLSLNGKDAPVIDGLSGDQRFFLGWAQAWRRLYRDQELMQRLVTDPHSPSEFRTSVVRNLDAWYDAFKIQPGDKLYLAPNKRVRIW